MTKPYSELAALVMRAYDEDLNDGELTQVEGHGKLRAQMDSAFSDIYQAICDWRARNASTHTSTEKTPGPFDRKPAKPMPPPKPSVTLRLANARQGEPYEGTITLNGPDGIKVRQVSGLDAVGNLSFDPDNATVKGTPCNHGTFRLVVTLAQSTIWDHPMDLSVIPDPKSLWKNVDSDRNTPYWKPDSDRRGLKVDEGYIVVAASQRGRSHAQGGLCRDDDFCVHKATATGWHVLAVSDGAGSAKYSREGSRIAVQNATDLLVTKLDEQDDQLTRAYQAMIVEPSVQSRSNLHKVLYNCLAKPVYDTIRVIDETARIKELSFRDFYATLLLSAHKPIDGRHCVFGYWRGDGAMAYHVPGRRLFLLGKPDSGDYAGQTRFLEGEAAHADDIFGRVAFDALEDHGNLVLMTDGISDPMFETDVDLTNQAAWDWFFERELLGLLTKDPDASADRLLQWMDFWSQGNHDDRTLAILCPLSELPDEGGPTETDLAPNPQVAETKEQPAEDDGPSASEEDAEVETQQQPAAGDDTGASVTDSVVMPDSGVLKQADNNARPEGGTAPMGASDTDGTQHETG